MKAFAVGFIAVIVIAMGYITLANERLHENAAGMVSVTGNTAVHLDSGAIEYGTYVDMRHAK